MSRFTPKKNLSMRKLLHKKDPKVEDCFEAAGGCCLPGPMHVAPWISCLWPWWRAEHVWLAWFIHVLGSPPRGCCATVCAHLASLFQFFLGWSLSCHQPFVSQAWLWPEASSSGGCPGGSRSGGLPQQLGRGRGWLAQVAGNHFFCC